MQKYLIITEKPSARENFKIALGGESGTFAGFNYDLTSLRGHLLELADPDQQVPQDLAERYKTWDLAYLPWDFTQFKWRNKYIKSTDAKTKKVTSTKHLLEALKQKIAHGNYDALVIATDTDPSGEGELLAWETILTIGWTGTVLRANFMDESVKSIQSALHHLRDVSDFSQDGDFQKGLARSRWDFASMQLTRIATIFAKKQGYYFTAREGRLKSAMLWKIYSQLQAIKDYKRVPFYEVRFKDEQGNVYRRQVTKDDPNPSFRYAEKTDGAADLTHFHDSATELIEQSMKYQKPPKLLDLSSLSALLAKEGFQAQEVLDTYQHMYEAQVVSYPRTEDKTITPEQFNDLLPLVNQIADLVGVDRGMLTHLEPRSSHVKPTGAHGANRPGTNVPQFLDILKQYGPSASRIYQILARNYLAMLAEDYQYQATKAKIIDFPDFVTTLNVPVKLNWKAIYSEEDEKQSDSESQGTVGTEGKPYLFEGQNSKPTHPTWSWLKNFLEKYEIGTGSTRTKTYAELASGEEAFIKETRGKIDLTERGAIAAYLAKDTYIADPAITKRLFEIFQDVGEFKLSTNHALDSLTKTVEHDLPIMRQNSESLVQVFGQPSPEMVEKKPKDKVNGTWNGKAVSFNKEWGNYTFSDDEIKRLLAGETIEFVATSKKNKPYAVKGKLADQSYKGKPFFGFKKE
ncbi:DNA topoisomerase [Weissella viridescens]|uniref:DNA topoisomerase n=1 Tax=Weissella viridescens TaxID=1629 RepID=UPI003AF2CA47